MNLLWARRSRKAVLGPLFCWSIGRRRPLHGEHLVKEHFFRSFSRRTILASALFLYFFLLASPPAEASPILEPVQFVPRANVWRAIDNIVLSPDERNLYVLRTRNPYSNTALERTDPGTIQVFRRDSFSGQLSLVQTVTPTPDAPLTRLYFTGERILASPDGRWVFLLSARSYEPASLQCNPSCSWGNVDREIVVTSFARDAVSGELSVAGNLEWQNVAQPWADMNLGDISSDGQQLYIPEGWGDGTGKIRVVDIGPHGELTWTGTELTGNGLDAYLGELRFLDETHFILFGGSPSSLSLFRRNPDTGAILRGASFATLNSEETDCFHAAVTGDNRHIYCRGRNYDHLNGTTDLVFALYEIDLAANRLEQKHLYRAGEVTWIPQNSWMGWPTLSTDERMLFVPNMYDDSITVLSRDVVTGELAFLEKSFEWPEGADGTYESPYDPLAMGVASKDGRFYYLGREDGVSVFHVATSCKLAAATKLRLRAADPASPSRGLVTWKWLKGESVTLEDLGEPGVGTNYNLVLSDAAGELLSIDFPAGTNWNGKGEPPSAWEYKSAKTLGKGARRLSLRTGEPGRSAVSLVAKGPMLDPLPRALTGTVTLKLTNDAGTCWASECEPFLEEADGTIQLNCLGASCGDGQTRGSDGEDCDAGGVETATCDLNCTLPACGDGIANAASGEQCDGDDSVLCPGRCLSDCLCAECGDGVVDSQVEECDSGGVATSDCDTDCTTPVCGDDVTNPAVGEDCDGDSDFACPGRCADQCACTSCGDGIVQPPETCDGSGETTVCDEDCTAAVCGDLDVNRAAGEQCDGYAYGDCDEGCRTDCTCSCEDSIVEFSGVLSLQAGDRLNFLVLAGDSGATSSYDATGIRYQLEMTGGPTIKVPDDYWSNEAIDYDRFTNLSQPAVSAWQLPYNGRGSRINGSVTNAGPLFHGSAVEPYVLHDDARDILLAHPGATEAAGSTVVVETAGEYSLVAQFVRANDTYEAGDGVKVEVLLNRNRAAPLFSQLIPSASRVFGEFPFGCRWTPLVLP